MKVKLKASATVDNSGKPINNRYVTVSSLKQASKMVRDFIELHDLTAGCGSDVAFTGGEILEDGEKIATVSYNGRVRDLAQQEIKL